MIVLALLLALCLALAGCGGAEDEGAGETDAAPPAEASAGSGSIELDELEPCDGPVPKPKEFVCGEITVPYERADRELGETTVGFGVRPREQREKPSLGAIFAVEGGPGYSSTGTANAYTKLFGDLLERRELVLVDMRGTGRSKPVDCPQLQRGIGPDHLTLAECARRLGPLADAYRTSATADDIDDVREALGFDRIALYGDSYGTFLAQSYAYRHPDTLEAMVLDSAYPAFGEDPWYPSIPQTGIRSMSIACERSPQCSGDAYARLEDLAEYLRKSRRGTGKLLDALFDAGSNPPDSYLRIDRVGAKLIEGERGPWRRLIREDKVGSRHIRSYARAGELVVSCNDYPMIWDKEASEPERREQLERAIRDYDEDAFLPFTPREVAHGSELGYLYCLTYPPPGANYEPAVDPDEQRPTEAPVLVVSGELDSVTTPEEGRTVAGFFPNSEYFEHRNGGHVDALYYSNGEPARRMRQFLREVYAGKTG